MLNKDRNTTSAKTCMWEKFIKTILFIFIFIPVADKYSKYLHLLDVFLGYRHILCFIIKKLHIKVILLSRKINQKVPESQSN